MRLQYTPARLTQAAAERAEMSPPAIGGKNALIIDDDADPDQAVPAAAYSAFGYAGQKCSAASRLIVVDRAYDAVVERLVGCSEELLVGHPATTGVQVGPVIDGDAHERGRQGGEGVEG